MLRDTLLSVLCAPVSEAAVTTELSGQSSSAVADALVWWLQAACENRADLRFRVERNGSSSDSMRVLDFTLPTEGRAVVRAVSQEILCRNPDACVEETQRMAVECAADVTVVVLCADESRADVRAAVRMLLDSTAGLPASPLIMEPRWTAALVVERLKPLIPGDRHAEDGGMPFFDRERRLQETFRLSRADLPHPSIASPVGEDTGLFRHKVEEAQRRIIPPSPVFLATVFFPPVAHSLRAVERFYKHFGSSDEVIRLVRERARAERRLWLQHIARHQRIDVLDRGQIAEYLAAPEYYQMPLTKRELREQVDNVIELLKYDNYQLRFSHEAVDLPFELTGEHLRVRTDRRNKGQPRQGRVTSLSFDEPQIRDVFEREFWTLFRSSDPELVEKEKIARWLRQAVRQYSGGPSRRVPNEMIYDVFLCHNSRNKAEVKRIGRRLRDRGITPWLDEWDAPPGVPWVWALQSALDRVRAAAVFVGDDGFGPWQNMELNALLMQFVRRGCPVIPVLLASARDVPQLPLFLEGMTWVDLRRRTPNPLDRLIWGIDAAKRPLDS